jgi:hypothetical protein
MQEYGKYVYAVIFNKLRSVGTQEDIEECFSDVFADIFIKFEYDEKYASRFSAKPSGVLCAVLPQRTLTFRADILIHQTAFIAVPDNSA